jgi:hypothetical protein
MGYPAVSLRDGKESEKRYVHDLVLRTFVGPPSEGYKARHFPDSTRTNCKLSNLRWGTQAENIGDHRGTYITDGAVRKARSLRKKGMFQKDIAKRIGCTQGYVSEILSGKHRASTK